MNYIANNKEEYIEKVYAGWLGKLIGVRHGANIEGWSYDKIQKTYGEIEDYIVDFKNFAADDDINGPLFFQRALDDSQCSKDITPEEMGKAWLNYIPYPNLPAVFLWFGGYGISTEHTAYINMINGIKPPMSGSIKQNGPAVAEQIGGQIFSDCWGLVAPGNPGLAAELAEKMASVSHDGNGLYGGRFIAAAIALAFVESDIEVIVNKALSHIPEDCDYSIMSRRVISFYKDDSKKDWRQCFQYIFENYGYDRYPGNCHVMPNAAVVVMGLIYSQGDFSKGINISNMAGWDTDCNVGNIGTILAVMKGVDGIDEKWIKPINDFVCCSNVIGSLNILDLPWMASDTSRLGFKLAGAAVPESWKEILLKKSISCHFEYPGSTHAIRVRGETGPPMKIENTTDRSSRGKRSLKIMIPSFSSASSYQVYLQTYYQSHHFDDSRYNPSFSPIFYPGGSFQAQIYMDKEDMRSKEEVKVIPFCKSITGEFFYGETQKMVPGEWNHVSWTVSPELEGVEEIGFDLRSLHAMRDATEHHAPAKIFYVDDFCFDDHAHYVIDTSKDLFIDTWSGFHKPVSQCVKNRGIWDLEEGMLTGSHPQADDLGDIYTGNYYWKDYSFSATIQPITGKAHGMIVRANGAMTGYMLYLTENDSLVLKKNDYGLKTLKEIPFTWKIGEEYRLKMTVIGSTITVEINEQQMMTFTDKDDPYLSGCVGFTVIQGRVGIKDYQVNTIV